MTEPSGAAVYADTGLGETRVVTTDARDRPVRLAVRRWSEEGALWCGDVVEGRVRRLAPQFGGAFVDLGGPIDGFLPGKDAKGLSEGARVRVRIAAEAAGGKGPRVRRTDAPVGAAPWPPTGAVTGPAARTVADEALDLATAPRLAVPGGGSITVEPTQALVAVDIDADGREARGGREGFAEALNIAAAPVVAQAVGLRGLGGIVAVDCVHVHDRAARTRIAGAFQAAFAEAGLEATLAPLSRFCVLELAVTRTVRPLHEALNAPDGRPTVETRALGALRALEREASADRGARLALVVAPDEGAWLEADPIGWREALAGRIGARFTVEVDADAAPGHVSFRPWRT